METYEKFKTRNANWNYCGFCMEKDMQRNYEIACNTERIYNETFGNIDGPRIGDIVEFSDGFRVYDHAKVVENLYGGSEYGMLCVCENGSSHTDGKYFSTSGGAFKAIHKSKFQYVGEDENIVWTWGCFGAGGGQGIYFPLKVRKWIIPYAPIDKRSTLKINGGGNKTCHAVEIQNFGEWFFVKSFISVRAFLAWAKYVGYEHHTFGNGTFNRKSPQKIVNMCILDMKDLPKNAKPIKVMGNGRIRDGWVVTSETEITEIWLNKPNEQTPKFGSIAFEEQIKEKIKYECNPLGV